MDRMLARDMQSERAIGSGVSGLRLFLISCVLILSLTAIAKFVSAFGDARILEMPDPLWIIKNRMLLIVVGSIEMMVVAALLARTPVKTKCLLLIWLGGNFLLYRAGSAILKPGTYCPCLGTLTEVLGISERTAAYALVAISCYLLLGGLVCHGWIKHAGTRVSDVNADSGGELHSLGSFDGRQAGPGQEPLTCCEPEVPESR